LPGRAWWITADARFRDRIELTHSPGRFAMSTAIDAIKPGQTLTVTVTAEPRREDDRQTIARLMRQDPAIKKRLKGAQKQRLDTLVVRSRGKRPWAVRRQVAKVARVEQGATWSFPWLPNLAGDLRSVEKFLDFKAG